MNLPQRVVSLRTARVVLLVIGLATGAAACGYPTQPIVPVQAVKVTPQSVQFFAIGETANLSATVFPADATDQAVTWESSDPSVVSVDAAGRITARSVGFGVFITVFTRDGRRQASATVNVNP
jgi:uncharacterized protein YjdB